MSFFPTVIDLLTPSPPRSTNGTSKYLPHQGERECFRRRVGGFALLRRMRTAEARYKAAIQRQRDAQTARRAPSFEAVFHEKPGG